ncbi:sigma-54-dependent Fis family transcriptional regulator [Thioalkalivibrio sp. ALE23]|uniref:sigma-54 interaction domain-containing protein n=1 Tax=Thioalkalivibrio sp. ALE23 TaxID=1265495 RepID=UPI00037D0526|nr:sigma-54 dependent transcriptional regulator [Thioalkalivibrio sp. ALE23]
MPRATLLLVNADAALRERVVQVLATIPRVRLQDCSEGELERSLEAQRPEVVLIAHPATAALRERIPARLPVAVISPDATHDNEIAAMRAGVDAHFGLPDMAAPLAQWLRDQLPGPGSRARIPEMVAHSERMRSLDAFAERIAQTAATVFITGESGVGKEVLARQIHARSARAQGPFEAINCAALPEAMLEALLFGHAKGAFTGAIEARPGKFVQADGGTLLLDEVTEIPVHLQPKLLRVLQEREVEPLGGRRTRPVDVRVIATSNRDLREAVAEGVLREDLYYRLSVFPVRIPPLRERPEDIPSLARALLTRASQGRLVELAPEAESRLMGHDWPGNARELANVMERAATLAGERSDGRVTAESIWLDADMLEHGEGVSAAGAPSVPAASDDDIPSAPLLEQTLHTQESRVILNVLREAGGRRKEAAERLGISPRTLRYKLARLRESGIHVPRTGVV